MKNNWNTMALAYDSFIDHPLSFSKGIEMPAVLSLVPSLSQADVLDLGCGSGRFAFEFEKMGAKTVIGIDFSDEMIDLANKKKEQMASSVSFFVKDASQLDFKEEKFDFIFSSTLLHFIEDIKTLLQSLYKLLKKDGQVILSLIHPSFSAHYPIEKADHSFPESGDWQFRYLDHSRRAYVQPWLSLNDDFENELCVSYHHTLADYFQAILSAGFQIDELVEPNPPESWRRNHPKQYHTYIKNPTYLILKLKL